MAEQSTTTTPTAPEWAGQALEGLARITTSGHLTATEQDLLDAAFLTLRARLGESILTDPQTIVRSLLRSALAGLDAARPIDNVITDMETTLAELKTYRDGERA